MSSIFNGINEAKRSPEPDYDDPSWDEKVSNVGQKAKQAEVLKSKGKEPKTRWNPETKKYYVDFSDVDESAGLPSPGTYEQTNDMFKSSGQRRIGTLTTENDDPFRGTGGRFNRGDDERHDLDPSDWYKKVGTKMYTASIYPRQKSQAEREGWHRTKEEARANASPEGVAEGSDYTPPELGTVKANLMNTQEPTVQVQVFKHNTLRGDSYWVTREVRKFKTMDQAQAYIDRINKQGVAETNVSKYKDMGATNATTHFIKNVTTGKIVSPHRSLQDAQDALVGSERGSNDKFKIVRARKGVAEEKCPHCGGVMVSEELMNEKKDACYYKVKSRYKVWPSAYASGALVKCRKSHGNWGNGGKKNESSILEGIERADENLHQWFKEKWVRFGPDGKIRGDCARGDDSEGKPKCLPQSKAQNLGKKGRASAASRKRREDPNPERSGPAINVNTKKK